jgi:hypothetical protein
MSYGLWVMGRQLRVMGYELWVLTGSYFKIIGKRPHPGVLKVVSSPLRLLRCARNDERGGRSRVTTIRLLRCARNDGFSW